MESDTKKAPGPPPKYDTAMKRTHVMMPDHLKEYARQAGDGSVAEGVRQALEYHMEHASQ